LLTRGLTIQPANQKTAIRAEHPETIMNPLFLLCR